jgi:hypothetical protein
VDVGYWTFADLALEREPVTRRLRFAPAPLAQLCRANGLDPATTFADEDLACWLICEWYLAHLEAGGEPDQIVEDILAEVAELEATGIAALQPGTGIPS